MCNKLTAHSEAVKEFLNADLESMLLKSCGRLSEDGTQIIIQYFAQKHYISLQDGNVSNDKNTEIPINDCTLILQYLKQCSGLPPRGKWLSFLELPEGIHHHVPFLNEACKPISNTFHNNIDLLSYRASFFGGQPLTLGDFSIQIPAFTKLPLAVVFWKGDDEFPSKSTILFDAVAPYHLSTAALWVLGCELAKKLTKL